MNLCRRHYIESIYISSTHLVKELRVSTMSLNKGYVELQYVSWYTWRVHTMFCKVAYERTEFELGVPTWRSIVNKAASPYNAASSSPSETMPSSMWTLHCATPSNKQGTVYKETQSRILYRDLDLDILQSDSETTQQNDIESVKVNNGLLMTPIRESLIEI